MARVAQPGGATAADALAAFDALEPVDVAFMLGAWTGESWPSGHALDGVLEAYGWVGKRFDTPDAAHPLVFRGWGGDVHLVPILDAFRALDRDTVMGCMDLKGMARPFFFLLRRVVARP